jgi:hypothetical protein
VLLDSFRRGAAHGLPVGEWLHGNACIVHFLCWQCLLISSVGLALLEIYYHAVCKIAMHRQANLAAFLENQGILSVTPLCCIVCFFAIYISRVPYLLIFIIVCI